MDSPNKTEPLLALNHSQCHNNSDSHKEHSNRKNEAPYYSSSRSSYSWPNVFDETYEMLLASIMLYGIVDLRTLAAKGVLEDGGGLLLELPASATNIVRLVSQNRQSIQEQIGDESTQLYLSAFDSIVEEEALELELNNSTGQVNLASFDIVAVGDDEMSKKLVYGICVNSTRQQIIVMFRGCTTVKDWQVSAQSSLTLQSTTINEGSSAVSIHHGFFNYLFHRPSSSSEARRGNNRFEEIVNDVDTLLEQYPGYAVYVTGHSLGAALATVFTFEAASMSLWQGPITCITFASPMVGNLSFEQAFKTLERQGRIRCLRVTNHFDIFTQLPDRGLYAYACCFCPGVHLVYQILVGTVLFYSCCQNRVYRHVGMDLHLYSQSGEYKVKHAKGSHDNCLPRLIQDWKRHWKQMIQRIMTVPFVCCCDQCYCKEDFNTNHGCNEHLKRLKALSGELSGLYLKDLYTKRLDVMEDHDDGDDNGFDIS